MKRLIIGLAMAAATTSSLPVQAQTPIATSPGVAQPQPGSGRIRGAAVDAENNAPVVASIAVWSTADSALATGVVASKDGTFNVEGLRPGTYHLKASALGYNTFRSREITISAADPRVSLGTLKLSKSAVAIEGIEVTSQRAAVTVAPDRNTYLAKDVAPAGGTASDVLGNVPSVQVDADGKVSLRGNENVAVQINGRPAPIRGEQLGGYLKQLPANMIERVEVVPNPSAKQDPEGMAGIINIVMKEGVDLGTSYGVMLGTATGGKYSGSGNVGYQRGAMTLFGTYGFNRDAREMSGFNEQLSLRTDTASFLLRSHEDVVGRNTNYGHNLSGNLDYKLTDRDVLSVAAMLNVRGSSEGSLNAYSDDYTRNAPTLYYVRDRDGEGENLTMDYTLALKRTIEPQRHELGAELRYNRSDDRDANDLYRALQTGAGATPDSPIELESRRSNNLTHEINGQTDYTLAFGRRSKIETGYKGTLRLLDDDYDVRLDPIGNGQWTYDEDASTQLQLDDQVHAAYGVFSQGVGKVDLQGGLRGEYATRDFTIRDEAFPYDKVSFFPSGIVSFNATPTTQLKASYSRRIRRPGMRELNPFPRFFDPRIAFFGNPQLDPEYTDAIELGLQKSGRVGSLQLSPFYRRTSNVIRFVITEQEPYGGDTITTVRMHNLESGNSWGTDVNGNVRFGKRASLMGSFNLFKMVTEGGTAQSALSSDAVNWSVYGNANLSLTPRLDLQTTMYYRGPMEFETGKFSSFQMMNVTLRQKVMGDRGSVSLRVQDPFDRAGFRVERKGDEIEGTTARKFGAQAVFLNFQFNAGKAPRVRQRPQPQGDGGGSPLGM